jgi:glycosyltransferase involved in cell wall biosynthesis
MRELVARQHAAFHALMDRANRVVALCEWTRALLVNNNVPAAKISLVRHGLAVKEEPLSAPPELPGSQVLRMVALGRLEPIKGLDLPVRALAELPGLPVVLHIYGILQSETETPYARQLRGWIARDPRIRLLPPVPHAQVIRLLRKYDVLAVPSQWFETGPFVVLEAFAAGIPVLGSDLGGIAENVSHGVDGILVPSVDGDAWREAIRRLARDRALLERLRANVRPPRSMQAVAQDMLTVYGQVSTA